MNSFELIKKVLVRKEQPGVMVLAFEGADYNFAKGAGDFLVVAVKEHKEVAEADFVVLTQDLQKTVDLLSPDIVVVNDSFEGKIKGAKLSGERKDTYFL